ASILDSVRAVAAGGTAVIYTTHYLEEVERLCDRIAILDHGRILAEGTLEELKARLAEEEGVTLWARFAPQAPHEAPAALPGGPACRVLSSEQGRIVFAVRAGGAAGLVGALYGRGLPLDRLAMDPPSLNALFLKLTGRELRD